ncbi:leucine-rich repeat domain-containing protein [Candidatus Halobeggiatoa sp. HSG11]|nr:leucine-rich repeat domain-containing protein [Candidatus Halobeggiatoa sp. HSG11]
MGTIPNFKSFPNLERLHLSENFLTGTIPNFSNLPNLSALSLGNNQLTGKTPDFINLPNLTYLDVENNQLTTVKITLEKESYTQDEQFKAELTETFSEDYDLYVAILFPNNTDFVTLEDTNKFTQLNQIQKW